MIYFRKALGLASIQVPQQFLNEGEIPFHPFRAGGELAKASAGVSLRLNPDRSARAMTGSDLAAGVAAWRAGALSRELMLEVLKRGEMLPDGRSVSQEQALIDPGSGAAV